MDPQHPSQNPADVGLGRFGIWQLCGNLESSWHVILFDCAKSLILRSIQLEAFFSTSLGQV